MHVFDHSFRSLLFVYSRRAQSGASRSVKRRPMETSPMDSKHSSVAPTAESNLSSCTGNTSIADIRKGTTKGTPLLKRSLLQTARFYFAFQRIAFLRSWERERVFLWTEMDSFTFLFLIFWVLGELERKKENFFCDVFYNYL